MNPKLLRPDSIFFCLLILILILVLILSVSSDSLACWGTRPLSMGGAFSAVSDDVHSIYWNPAGLSRVKNFDFTYSRWLNNRDNINYDDFAAGAISVGICTLGVGLTYNQDKFSEPIKIGGNHHSYKCREKNRYINFGCGTSISRTASIGLNINTLKTIYYGYHRPNCSAYIPFSCSDNILMVDFGFLWELMPRVTVGLLAQNLNKPKMYFPEISRREIYISNLRPAVAWKMAKEAVLAVDLYDATNNSRGVIDRNIRIGMEAGLPKGLTVRLGGYHTNNRELRAYTAGFGWRFAGLKLDYGFMYWESISDTQHMLALGYSY
ncbi:MAG: hypothetical protein K6U11_12870 [bacterium]|nr:hypothetical protein [bacterium]